MDWSLRSTLELPLKSRKVYAMKLIYFSTRVEVMITVKPLPNLYDPDFAKPLPAFTAVINSSEIATYKLPECRDGDRHSKTTQQCEMQALNDLADYDNATRTVNVYPMRAKNE